MAEKSKLAGSVGVTVFFGVYWDQYQQHPTGISLFQTISRHNPILTGLLDSSDLILIGILSLLHERSLYSALNNARIKNDAVIIAL